MSSVQQRTSFVNHQKSCDKQVPGEVREKCELDREPNNTNIIWRAGWPDWGEPLPPEDLHEETDLVDYAVAEVKKTQVSEKMVADSDVIYISDSSDDELNHGNDQVTKDETGFFESKVFSAANMLVKMSSEFDGGNSKEKACVGLGDSITGNKSWDSQELSALLEMAEKLGDVKVKSFEESQRVRGRASKGVLEKTLDELLKRVHKLQDDLYEESLLSGSKGSTSREGGTWTYAEKFNDFGMITYKRRLGKKDQPRKKLRYKSLGNLE